MSTANFEMTKNFPLFIMDDRDEDEFSMQWLYDDIQKEMEDLNYDFMFHKLSIKSGYYCGVQFFAEEEHNPNEYDNEDCHYYFDECRSISIRKYKSEINKINKLLRKLAESYGFEEYGCVGVFSNGEAIYYKV